MKIEIKPAANSLQDWYAVYAENASAFLGDAAIRNIERSATLVDRLVAEGKPVYGVNTGFGKLSEKRIDQADLEQLQENLVLSHTVGVGEPLPVHIVRLAMALKLAALSQGASGVRLSVPRLIEQMLEVGVTPVVPAQGSVGASGDLSPLAAISAVMIGRGQASYLGQVLPGGEALSQAGLTPLRLGPKEGLALLNGTQVTTALALAGFFEIRRLFQTALVTAALSVEAGMGSTAPFDARIQALKPHPGQIEVAATLRDLLQGGEIRERHAAIGRLQDPYCLRCLPQVMGACRDVIGFAAGMLETEANSVSDNPLLLMDTGEVVSGGNFHAEAVGFAADMLANVAAEIGGMSERRTAFLIDASMSGLPAFLTGGSGLTSGFMSLQITAAALVAENRQKSHPAVVDSVPTVGNQEDFVSMATHGARRLLEMARNAESIVAIELLAAVEGIDHRAPLHTGPRLEPARQCVREVVPSMAIDWEFSSALRAAEDLVHSGRIIAAAELPLL
jgi:histidine ammonia-lyase